MSQEKLIQVKTALADKYARLARAAKGKPKQKTYLFQSDKYRRQAKRLAGG
jgi:hypothetical protein